LEEIKNTKTRNIKQEHADLLKKKPRKMKNIYS
jgi:hypothetical protein